MQYDYNKNGRSDFMCTNSVQYLIRDDKVHAIVQMRSNDAIFGTKNDLAFQRYVINRVSKDTGYSVGNIYWNAGSLHIYERHFPLIQEYIDAR
jgi:thymidylate synthase